MRAALVIGGLGLVLAFANAAIVGKERALTKGTPVLLELAPVDPRSLIQGDYMQLRYRLTEQLTDSQAQWPSRGAIVVALDDAGVAGFVRRHDGRAPLGRREHLLAYRRRDGRISVATDAFYFQEGDAGRYAGARYGELRVTPSGAGILVGLRDSARAPLGRSR
jgi:uncharacterized membrane-anchored protein